MDKNTLTHYGWAIIVLIIIAILLGLATPFGSYVKMSVGNTVKGFGEKISADLNADAPGLDIGSGDNNTSSGDKVISNSTSLMRGYSEDLMRDLFSDATSIVFEEGLPDYNNLPENIRWGDFTDHSVINTGGRVILYMDVNDKVLHVCSNGGKIYFPENSDYLFSCVKAKSIDFNDLVDTSLVTSMQETFDFSGLEKEVDFSCFNTSNVVNMAGLFRYYNLPTLDLSSFNFSSLKNARHMFYYSKLVELDITKLNGEQINAKNRMLDNCFDLKTIYYDGKEISHNSYIVQQTLYHSYHSVNFDFEETFEEFPLLLKKMYYDTHDIPSVKLNCKDGQYTVCAIEFSGRWKYNNEYVEVNYG